jgi:hypothetical protein
MKVWTFVTAPLYENQWYLVPCSVAVLFASGIVLEPLWGTKEFLVGGSGRCGCFDAVFAVVVSFVFNFVHM